MSHAYGISQCNDSAAQDFTAQAAVPDHGSHPTFTQRRFHAGTGVAQRSSLKHGVADFEVLVAQGIEVDAGYHQIAT